MNMAAADSHVASRAKPLVALLPATISCKPVPCGRSA